jgi:hypothetical protein
VVYIEYTKREQDSYPSESIDLRRWWQSKTRGYKQLQVHRDGDALCQGRVRRNHGRAGNKMLAAIRVFREDIT